MYVHTRRRGLLPVGPLVQTPGSHDVGHVSLFYLMYLFCCVRGLRFHLLFATYLPTHLAAGEGQINAAAEVIYGEVDPTANIIFGALVDERMEGRMSITVLATGFQTKVSSFSPLRLLSCRGWWRRGKCPVLLTSFWRTTPFFYRSRLLKANKCHPGRINLFRGKKRSAAAGSKHEVDVAPICLSTTRAAGRSASA